jgi:hypothetical protein
MELCKQYRSSVQFNVIASIALINQSDPCKRAFSWVGPSVVVRWCIIQAILVFPTYDMIHLCRIFQFNYNWGYHYMYSVVTLHVQCCHIARAVLLHCMHSVVTLHVHPVHQKEQPPTGGI